MTHGVLRSEALGGLKASPGPGTSHVPAGTNRALRRSYGNGAVDEILCVRRGVAAGELLGIARSHGQLSASQDQLQAG